MILVESCFRWFDLCCWCLYAPVFSLQLSASSFSFLVAHFLMKPSILLTCRVWVIFFHQYYMWWKMNQNHFGALWLWWSDLDQILTVTRTECILSFLHCQRFFLCVCVSVVPSFHLPVPQPPFHPQLLCIQYSVLCFVYLSDASFLLFVYICCLSSVFFFYYSFMNKLCISSYLEVPKKQKLRKALRIQLNH